MASVFHVPFIRNKELIADGDSAGLDIDLGNAAALALLGTTPFPHQTIPFGQVTASAADSADMKFLPAALLPTMYCFAGEWTRVLQPAAR